MIGHLYPTIPATIARRGISEVLHFTTHHGLLGILAEGAVLNRDDLNVDDYVSSIYIPNCQDRLKDADWTGYVNLSISHVNKRMLDYSNNWHKHEDVWWTILSFSPEILEDDGVWFTTTNNTYPPAKRGTGVSGLEQMFAEAVGWGWRGDTIRRNKRLEPHLTTCPQAEVLYPGRLSLKSLQAIYVLQPYRIDSVQALLATLPDVPTVPVIENVAAFNVRR